MTKTRNTEPVQLELIPIWDLPTSALKCGPACGGFCLVDGRPCDIEVVDRLARSVRSTRS